ncbi:uncharacterized protein LOC124648330 [Lolium rigidum]|uniref:uncharacterized protein LOC124648330 n=1 Tax=Lolium rigidum TaxID=89674 RepID=UPI001F5C8F5A|nr:uncharacterized protein LOC124648330 [Lolium rigidum]
MELHELASLPEIDALAVEQQIDVLPGPDVVLVGLHSLREAPAALERLELHQAEHDWRTLNLSQVRMASSLVDLLIKMERRLGRLARAILRMEAASTHLEDVSGKVQSHCSQMAGPYGIYLASRSGINAMGRLDANEREINDLLNGAVAKAKSQRWLTSYEDFYLGQMQQALVSLQDTNHAVVRRIDRVRKLVDRLQVFWKPTQEELRHALSLGDPELRGIARRVSSFIRRLLARIPTRGNDVVDFINMRQHRVSNRLNRAIYLNHQLYSGQLNVRSLRDLNEVSAISAPHNANAGLPVAVRQVHVQIQGLNVLSAATAMFDRVYEGIEQMGWTVQGLGALTTAKQLDDSLVAFRSTIYRLRNMDVVAPLGEVLKPELFNEMKQQALDINQIMFDGPGSVVCEDVGQFVEMVIEVWRDSRLPDDDHNIHTKLCKLWTALDFARTGEVFFRGA